MLPRAPRRRRLLELLRQHHPPQQRPQPRQQLRARSRSGPGRRRLLLLPQAPLQQAACALAHGFTQPRLVYAASKQAVSRWVRRVAPSPAWAGAGIAVNAVSPSVIDTPMAVRMLSPENLALAAAENPMPLTGIPASAAGVAQLLAWLGSAENGIVTGQVICADGGSDALIRGDDIF